MRKGVGVSTDMLFNIVVISILLIVVAAALIFGGVQTFAENIKNWMMGRVGYDLSDIEFGRAIMCAHWRCLKGCTYAKSLVEGCECDDNWDNIIEDGKICGKESKKHPIKVETTEEETVTEIWWKSKACEDRTCNEVAIKKGECGLDSWIFEWHSIIFSQKTEAGIECVEKKVGVAYRVCSSCTIPANSWYIWAERASTGKIHVIVCDEKPADVLSCAEECSTPTQGGSEGTCA